MPQPALRLAQAHDAVAIVDAIKHCYGDSYLVPAALRSGVMESQIARGDLVYALAEVGGAVVGQVALERVNSHGLYHHSRAVVAPEWRGQGLLRSLSSLLLNERDRPEDARLVLGTSVTSHTFTQRYNVRAGFTPLGLLLGLHPDQTLANLPTPPQAGSAVLMGLGCTREWRRRSFPFAGPARALATQVSKRLGIPYDLEPKPASLDERTLWTSWEEGPGGLWHLRYTNEPQTYGGPPAGAPLEWVDVPAEHAHSAELLERWHGAGLTLAAYFPLGGSQGEDVIRLQRCRRPLERDAIRTVEELRPLRDWIFELHTTREAVLQ